MFGKKLVVSVFALTIGAGVAIAASTSRSGSLRVNPADQSVKSVSNPVATTSASSRMATLPGPTNISTKPKLPSAASAAQVGDLKDKLDQLAQDVADLANAGVDENAVRDIINSEVDEKIAAIKPTAAIRYVDSTGDLQYQDSDDSWQTFANKSDFAGADGKNIELQKTTTAIQWRVKGSGEAWVDLVSLDEITGATGTTGADACEPKYSSAITADGDTRVTITCVNDDTKVLGQYTVSKGADGAIPCPGGIELEQDTAYSGADGATKYDLVCKE